MFLPSGSVAGEKRRFAVKGLVTSIDLLNYISHNGGMQNGGMQNGRMQNGIANGAE